MQGIVDLCTEHKESGLRALGGNPGAQKPFEEGIPNTPGPTLRKVTPEHGSWAARAAAHIAGGLPPGAPAGDPDVVVVPDDGEKLAANRDAPAPRAYPDASNKPEAAHVARAVAEAELKEKAERERAATSWTPGGLGGLRSELGLEGRGRPPAAVEPAAASPVDRAIPSAADAAAPARAAETAGIYGSVLGDLGLAAMAGGPPQVAATVGQNTVGRPESLVPQPRSWERKRHSAATPGTATTAYAPPALDRDLHQPNYGLGRVDPNSREPRAGGVPPSESIGDTTDEEGYDAEGGDTETSGDERQRAARRRGEEKKRRARVGADGDSATERLISGLLASRREQAEAAPRMARVQEEQAHLAQVAVQGKRGTIGSITKEDELALFCARLCDEAAYPSCRGSVGPRGGGEADGFFGEEERNPRRWSQGQAGQPALVGDRHLRDRQGEGPERRLGASPRRFRAGRGAHPEELSPARNVGP